MAAMDHPPVVDLSNFEERKQEIVADLMKAATTVGFFYIENHGVSQELIDRAFSSFSKYCDLPQDVKNSLPRVDWAARKILGYEVNRVPGLDGEYKIVRESHIQSYEVHEEARGAWPKDEQLPGFRDTTLEFMNALPPVVDRVLSCFALGLGYPENIFKETVDVSNPDNHTFLQYHKYPLTNGMLAKESTKRLTAHTDESLMTLLFTSPGSSGLELAAGKDGKAVDAEAGHYEVESWHPCPPLPGKISINIGDPLQFLSDGVLKSNYHRVRMPKAGEPGENKTPRYSIGYFVWPRDDYVIQGPKKVYPAITMDEFMKVKGKLYGAGFSEDPKIYEAHSDIAMGVPKMGTATTQLTAVAAS